MSYKSLLGGVERRLARRFARRDLRMRNSRPLVSFTFDDVYASACETGRAILEDHGVRGTYYASGGLSVETRGASGLFSAAHLEMLHRAGHEIGSHGYEHRHYQSLGADGIEADLSANDAFFRSALGAGFRALSFSFPFGTTGLSSKGLVAKRFCSARGVQSGVNSGVIDSSLLLATPLYETSPAVSSIAPMLDEVLQKTGWLIFYTHDVAASPSRFGCTPRSFANVVASAVKRGFDVLPVKAALAAAGGELEPTDGGVPT